MEWIASPEAWIALATLTVLETVLGIDNIVFIAIVAVGFGQPIPKGYLYFAMGFSIFVEMLNLRAEKTETDPVRLRGRRARRAGDRREPEGRRPVEPDMVRDLGEAKEVGVDPKGSQPCPRRENSRGMGR